jgi:glycosyltransferase involved in cell wall biosynthesis
MSISVIIPAWNAGRYLEATLASVFAQTLVPHQVIVVDDGSTDNTAKIAKTFAVHFEQKSHHGVAAARNTGIQLATGTYLAFLDADDLWLPQKLELQLEFLESKPDLDIVFAGIEQFISEDTPEVKAQVRVELGVHFKPSPSTLMLKKSTLMQIGVFPDLQGGDWIAWLAQAQRIGLKIKTLPICLAKRRIHATNFSRQQASQIHSDYLKLLRQHLQAKRQGAA